MKVRAKNYSIEDIGGKAYNLNLLRKHGFPIPNFKVIPSSTGYTIESYNKKKIEQLTSELEISSDDFAKQILAARIRYLINNSTIGLQIEKLVENWVKENVCELDHTFVRSSASTEDLRSTSSAGLYESFVRKTNKEEILKAITSVIESYYSDRAIWYRSLNGITQIGPRIGVILQKCINSTKSGVMLGIHPVTMNNNLVVIEATYGIGTALVSGKITPDRYVLQKSTGKVVDVIIGRSKIHHNISSNSRIVEKSIPYTSFGQQVLSLTEIQTLWNQYCKVEKLFKSPQDIEWAFDKESCWLLQARPITANYGVY